MLSHTVFLTLILLKCRYSGSDSKVSEEQQKKRALEILNEVRLKAKRQKLQKYTTESKKKKKTKSSTKKLSELSSAESNCSFPREIAGDSQDVNCNINEHDAVVGINASSAHVPASDTHLIIDEDDTAHLQKTDNQQTYDPLDHFKKGIHKIGSFTVLGDYENVGRAKVFAL